MSASGAPVFALPLRIVPPAAVGRAGRGRLVERNVVAYRHGGSSSSRGSSSRSSTCSRSGVGLNHLVGHLDIGGRPISYTDFVAPGLLASSAMNGAIFDATFGIFFKLKIAKTYDAVLATPLGVRDVAIGELAWSLIRGTVYSIAFLTVMAALGLVGSWWAVLCLPAAMLVELRLRGPWDVRHLLHAQLAGLRSRLARDRAVVLFLGRVLPALALPGLAPDRDHAHPALPGRRPAARSRHGCARSGAGSCMRPTLPSRHLGLVGASRRLGRLLLP